ncbi:hypothetical protein SAMN04487904_10349 [Actinopolyspora lacussalsi subsp. righensis]|uniref:Uncharacterized protein n=1 Tax=Actinopolyspora righensis TaxID=995060 RepID=A0A1I6YNZ7_9ACTN|nr:hypothetical protein SAMN04487904_10349 [Actinopolyspora righensis]
MVELRPEVWLTASVGAAIAGPSCSPDTCRAAMNGWVMGEAGETAMDEWNPHGN